jgi:hypothetical protein
MDNGIYSSR